MTKAKRRGKRTRKEKVDMLIVNANELVTLKGGSEKPRTGTQIQNLGIIRKGGLAVKDGRIVAVGKTPEIRKSFSAENVINASGKIVMPGFVDPHTHLVFAGSREDEFQMRVEGVSYMAILGAGGGILRTVRETRRAGVERLVEFGFKTLDVMLEHGTTTVEAKSGYGLTLKDELKILGVMKRLNQLHAVDVVPTFLGAHAIPLEYKNNPQEYVNLIIEEMIPRVAEKGLAEFCDVFCEKGVFNLEQTRRILVAGKNRGLKPKVHADEMSMFGGAELAAGVRAVSAEHLLFASDEGIKAMADKGVVAVLLPAAAFSLMTGRYADARKMIDFGVPVALGTDFNPSCWVENQQLVIAFACHFMRLTPAEAITAATINSAHAIGRTSEVGSLEIGKKADVIVLDVPNHMFLGYRFGVNLVDKVVKNGRLVVDKEASGIKTVGLS
ncbi:MAG: imidazolonepropionase [Candidatus Bathyarchaeia archaeon]|nr:imidazolonepropionase [Candidatus Bathyarchaeia archaeon]